MNELTFAPAPAKAPCWAWAIAGLTVALVPFMAWLMLGVFAGDKSLGYTIEPEQLVIQHRRPVVIPLADVRRAEVMTVSGGRRLFGTALPEYCQGKFRFAETGPITVYSTCKSPLVVIETETEKFGINPVQPAAFVAALEAREPGHWAALREGAGPGAGWTLWLPLVTLSVIVALTCSIIYLIRMPQRLRYVLTATEVLIDGGLLKVRIPYQQITAVTEATPPGRPYRQVGTDLGHLFWGRFGWRQAGMNLRLYATRIKPLVLLETARSTYGLTPADSEQFIRELQLRLETIGG